MLNAGLMYLRDVGVRGLARRWARLYLRDHQRLYLTRSDLARASERPIGRRGLQVRLARPEEARRLSAAFPHLSVARLNTWLAPDHFLLVALKGDEPVGFRCLSTRVGRLLRPALRLEPDQLFSVMSFVLPAFRRQGINHEIKTATAHLLRPRGFRETWGNQSPFNQLNFDATSRMSDVMSYVGTLTRSCALGRARFAFDPAAPLSPARVARPLELLATHFPHARRVALLANPASVLVSPGAVETTTARAPVSLHLVTVRECRDQAGAFRDAFGAVASAAPDAVVVLHDPMFVEHRATIRDEVRRSRLFAVYEGAEFADAGGVLVCGAPRPVLEGLPGSLRRITAGGRESDLLVNPGAARALGLTIPPSLQRRADRVLE